MDILSFLVITASLAYKGEIRVIDVSFFVHEVVVVFAFDLNALELLALVLDDGVFFLSGTFAFLA